MSDQLPTITDKLELELIEALGVEQDELQPSAHLEKDLGAGSIDHLDLIFRLKRSFCIKFQDGEYNELVFDDAGILKSQEEKEALALKNAQTFNNSAPGTVERVREVVKHLMSAANQKTQG